MTPLTTEITWNRRLLIKLTGNRNFLIPKTAIWKDSICDSNRSERHFQADLGLTYNLSTLTLTSVNLANASLRQKKCHFVKKIFYVLIRVLIIRSSNIRIYQTFCYFIYHSFLAKWWFFTKSRMGEVTCWSDVSVAKLRQTFSELFSFPWYRKFFKKNSHGVRRRKSGFTLLKNNLIEIRKFSLRSNKCFMLSDFGWMFQLEHLGPIWKRLSPPESNRTPRVRVIKRNYFFTKNIVQILTDIKNFHFLHGHVAADP